MKFRRQRRQHDDINMTPLIDVVFLLLIFFMVSTTFTKETRLRIELPEAEGRAEEQEPADKIEILVDKEGGLAVNGNLLVNRKVETIIAALEQVAGDDRTLPVIIAADGESPHRSVVTVMDAVGRLGFTKLSISTQAPQEQAE